MQSAAQFLLIIAIVASSLWMPQTSEAEIRRHIISKHAFDPDAVLNSLTESLQLVDFTVSSRRNEQHTIPDSDATFNVRLVEHRFYRAKDQYEINVTFFFLVDGPDSRKMPALDSHVQQQYVYSGMTSFDIGYFGMMLWYEYDQNTGQTTQQILDTELSLWRDEYIDSQ